MQNELVLERSARDLAAAIRSRAHTSREVVEAHIERLQAVQPGYRPLAADRFDAARAEADAADARVAAASSPDALPPLLGVPITIKESIALEGMPNCAGVVARRDHRAETTAPAAQRLIDAGAIPLGVTNVSEFTLWIESDNFVYGRSSSAYDPSRTAGGSSGGEGVAVGSGGSPLGLGTDIAGSIRLPAFFNGVFGHKPSPGLVPNTGSWPVTHGEASRFLGTGPLARRAEDLMPALRIIAGPDGEDEYVEEAELGDPADVRLDGMRVLVSEDAYPVSRGLREARERAAGALAAVGATVERVSLKTARRSVELYLAALQDGAGTAARDLLEEAGADTSAPLRRLAAGAVRRRGPHTLPFVITLASERLADRVPDRRRRRVLAAGRAMTEELAALPGDGVLLHPPFATTAPRHGRTVGRAAAIVPMGIFNMAPSAVTQVPLGLDDKGLPLGVQVVAAAGRDHVSIRVALELERVFGGWVPPWRP